MADRTIGRAFGTACRLSVVCRLSVTFCIMAKWYVLAKNCLKKRIGNQGKKIDYYHLPWSLLTSQRSLECVIIDLNKLGRRL